MRLAAQDSITTSAATSPEGLIDVIGYDLIGAPERAQSDFNGDGYPDLLLYSSQRAADIHNVTP